MIEQKITWGDTGRLAEFTLGVVFLKEGNTVVAHIPALDLTTHGESLDDTAQAARSASKLFLEELVAMGTAEEVLLNLGWRKSEDESASFPFVPPEVLAYVSEKVTIQCHA